MLQCETFNSNYPQVVAIHSQSTEVPECPLEWTRVGTGYSFSMVRFGRKWK